MSERVVAEGGPEPEWPDVRAGWRIAIGVGGIVASAFTFVLLPVVTTVVAGWWLVADMRVAGARSPGWLGKVALAVLAALWLAIAWLVVGFDAHVDCGGTLGGFGESANARLDDECFDRRILRVPIAMLIVLIGSVGAGVWVRRRARGSGDRSTSRPRSAGAAGAAVVGACTVVWTISIVVLVVT